jgi:urease accessory protein
MERLTAIVGQATQPDLARRLHEIAHAGGVEYLVLTEADSHSRRLRRATDRGTDCAVVLPRSARLSDGAVLLLEETRAIVVRLAEERWLDLVARDQAAALELGYFAGNMHWPVQFMGERLRIGLHGDVEDYLARLHHLLADGRIRRIDHG